MKTLILLCVLIAAVSCNVLVHTEFVFEDGCIGTKDYWIYGTTTTNLCCDQIFDERTEIRGVATSMLPGHRVLENNYMTLTNNKTNCHWVFTKSGRESF